MDSSATSKNPSLKTSSLPPLRISTKTIKLSPQEPLSSRLQLYFKLRASCKITINTPMECFLPSNLSPNNYSSCFPNPADVVMSQQPPVKVDKERADFKFSRLFVDKRKKDNSFLKRSIKATDHLNARLKSRRSSHPQNVSTERKNARILKKLNNMSKSSIPFLSEVMNRACRQSSKMLLNPLLRELPEIHEVMCRKKSSKFQIKEKQEEEFCFKTVEVSMQTEKAEVPVKNKRRVIFNKNSRFVDEDLDKCDGNMSFSSSDN